jgi:hypothetical protein
MNGGRCLSCSSSDFRELDTVSFRCVAVQGYYDSGAQVCVPCPQGCLNCSDSAHCFSCLSGYFMQGDSLCHTGCPLRYYHDSALHNCISCPYDCLTCDAQNGCLSCDGPTDHRVLNLSSLRCDPIPGYF